MLNVVDSTKFILTLQSSPPFIVESIFVLAFVILLAVPLFVNLLFYLGKSRSGNGSNGRWNKRDPRKRIAGGSPSGSSDIKEYHHETGGDSNSSSEERIRRAVVMHYPAPIPIESSSSSDFDLQFNVDSNRRTVSTPNLFTNGTDDRVNYEIKCDDVGEYDPKESMDISKKIKDVPVERSSSFVVTNSEVPIIDISTFNYNAYRHKLIEASLKKHYRNHQPPGDVIFNSIHLNTSDTTLGIRLNEEYDHSFFDFVEEYYDATLGMSKKEMEFLHPLDHFLVKGIRKRETDEKGTDTTNLSSKEADREKEIVDDNCVQRTRLCEKNDNNSRGKVKNFPNQSNDKKDSKKEPSKAEPKESFCESIGSRKDSGWLRKGRHVGAGLVDSNSIRRKLGRTSNVDQVQTRKYVVSECSNDTVKSVRSKLGSSIVKPDKDSIANVSSASSSELDSNRDVASNNSRDSSVPSSRDRRTTRKLLPWISGNPSVSFNRKYGNNRPETNTFERSKRAKLRSAERTSAFGSRPFSPRPRSANLTLTGKRKAIDQDRTKSERIDGLKAIEDYDIKGKGSLRSNSEEKDISSFAVVRPMTPFNLEPSSSISSRLLPKFLGRYENDEGKSRGSLHENVVGKSCPKFSKERDRRSRQESRQMTDNNSDGIDPSDVGKEIFKIDTNYERKSMNRTSEPNERTLGECRTKLLRERFVNLIDDENLSIENETDQSPKNNNEKPIGYDSSLDILKPKKGIDVSKNSDKTREEGNKSLIKIDTCTRSAVVSRDTLVLAKNDSRTQKPSSFDDMTLEKGSPIRRGLSHADSKVGLAVQTGLKNYIKKLKQLLKNDGNIDTVDLASLSLKDAISPELESILSFSELKELQDLLNITEIKSNLTEQNVV